MGKSYLEGWDVRESDLVWGTRGPAYRGRTLGTVSEGSRRGEGGHWRGIRS